MPHRRGEPTVDELLCIAQAVVAKWRFLGLMLGLTDAQLDEIAEDNNKALERSYAMLRKWKECKGSGANYKTLAAGLRHKAVGRNDLAEQYCRDEG